MIIITNIIVQGRNTKSLRLDYNTVKKYLKVEDSYDLEFNTWELVLHMDYIQFEIFNTETKKSAQIMGLKNLLSLQVFGIVIYKNDLWLICISYDCWMLLDYISSPTRSRNIERSTFCYKAYKYLDENKVFWLLSNGEAVVITYFYVKAISDKGIDSNTKIYVNNYKLDVNQKLVEYITKIRLLRGATLC